MTDVLETFESKGVCPMDCPDTCSWVVTVRDGKTVKLVGNREHPVTRGALCVKVGKYLEYTASPERILYPLIRVGLKGEGRFRRATWEEALETIATRLKRDIDLHGPEAVWPYFGVGSFGILQGLHGCGRRFWNRLGASQHIITICSIAGNFASGYTVGDNRMGMDLESIVHSRLILLWGTNTLSTNQHLRPRLDEARRNGARIIVIDPVRTRTAEYADEHIPIRPGTDAALALGLMNIVLEMGAEDRDFIDRHTIGFDKFLPRIAEFTPARVAEITGLSEARIRALGEAVATTRPTAIKTAMGIQRHAGGGMAVRALMCLSGITGDWRHAGGGTAYDLRGFFQGNWKALWRDDLRKVPPRTLSMTRLGQELNVTTLFIWASNPVASAPNTNRIREGLMRDDLFTVVADPFMTDTAMYADVILPPTMQTEHEDIHITYGHTLVSWNAKAVEPPGECLPMTEVFRRLARLMGYAESCLYESEEEMARQLLKSDHPSMASVTLERLKQDGFVRPDYPTPHVPFADGFPTPSGKLEFYSERMLNEGLDPLPGYTPPLETLQKDTELAKAYPLALITPAAHHFVNSMFGNWKPSSSREGEQIVVLHPDDAATRGLATGDNTEIFNSRGSFVARLTVSDAVPPGVCMSPKGHWPGRSLGSSHINATVDERDADFGGGAVFHDNRVEVRSHQAA